MKTLKQFLNEIKLPNGEHVHLNPDNSVHYKNIHIGNIFEKRVSNPLQKSNGYVAHSKYWNLKQEHKSKKSSSRVVG